MTLDAERRPRRRAAARSKMGRRAPSAVHYVGYVEDEETPEMIMKKFEALERVQQAVLDNKENNNQKSGNGADGQPGDGGKDAADGPSSAEKGVGADGAEGGRSQAEGAAAEGSRADGLDESHLLEIFKQTSLFSVNYLADQASDAMLEVIMGDNVDYEEELNASDFDSDEEDFWDVGSSRRKRGRGGSGAGGSRGSRGAGGHGAGLRRTVTVLNRETGVYVQRKVRVVDESLPQLLRIPNHPIPLSWGRTVKPYSKRVMALNLSAAEEGCRVFHEESIEGMNFDALIEPSSSSSKGGVPFLGVLINPDWRLELEAGAVDKADRLRCLKEVPLRKLCPTGFIFIWVEKSDVQNVCEWMYKLDYVYVENLTWVQMLPNNEMVHDHSQYTRRSHMTLYIFRKCNAGRDIELRHQRNPDVVLDCLQSSADGHAKVPQETYKAIETLLPGGVPNNKLLELWAQPQNVRKGWTQVIEAL
mmetsp:Transcript_6269/g.15494  ORF Transcript_6269/g.15494 Transcript_6269/m.15494 type:complete len:474 (+) Transcript_6269:82-1503(+)